MTTRTTSPGVPAPVNGSAAPARPVSGNCGVSRMGGSGVTVGVAVSMTVGSTVTTVTLSSVGSGVSVGVGLDNVTTTPCGGGARS